jgi:exonuclease VII small subunit
VGEAWRDREERTKQISGETAKARKALADVAAEARRNINRSIGKAHDRRRPDYRDTKNGETGMSAKEQMVAEIESAKEKLGEAIQEFHTVMSTIDEAQEKVESVMGEADESFAAAKGTMEAAEAAVLAVNEQLDTAIGEVNAAGSQ